MVDTVGSGDSMLAAFVYAKLEGYEDLEAFKFSVAAGSATAFSVDLASKEDIEKLYKNL
ncbi:PfkB family carbohydrate kinase [Histophilus somni]|uniref:PfkB family carbohydrate kinase n=1 Tax=Histophilus somni TaxID=731 RepID=UPI0034CD5D11